MHSRDISELTSKKAVIEVEIKELSMKLNFETKDLEVVVFKQNKRRAEEKVTQSLSKELEDESNKLKATMSKNSQNIKKHQVDLREHQEGNQVGSLQELHDDRGHSIEESQMVEIKNKITPKRKVVSKEDVEPIAQRLKMHLIENRISIEDLQQVEIDSLAHGRARDF